MPNFVEIQDLIPILKSVAPEVVPNATDYVCSPADVFLAAARLRNLRYSEYQVIVEMLVSEKTDFHHRLKHAALSIVSLEDNLDLLFADGEESDGLLNHYSRFPGPPESTVRALCEGAVSRMGW